MMLSREHWGTRFGFIMAAAGSAVGLGNIWKFPYVAGDNGGGAFLIIYLAFVAAFGLSLVIAELTVGRMAQKNPVGAFRDLAGGAWPLVGMLGVLTAFIILSFYIVVAGWTIAYIFLVARGALSGADGDQLAGMFGGFISDPVQPVIYAAVFMVLTCIVVANGIGKGIERASKFFMPVMFLLLVVIAVRSITLPGAGEGLRFFLQPDWSKVDAGTFTAAIGQAFFSLSLGMGALITYGSYMPRDNNLPADAASVVGLDTLVALLAGFAILPAVFSAGLDPGAGPGLTFITLPTVFAQMPGGYFFGIIFFVLLAVAALTSAVSLLETAVCYFIDEWNVLRPLAVLGCGTVCLLLGIPSSLSLGIWGEYQLFGKGFLDLMDYISSNIMLPVGGLLTAAFVGWVLGPRAIDAVTNGGTRKVPLLNTWIFILKFVAPAGILWVLIAGLT